MNAPTQARNNATIDADAQDIETDRTPAGVFVFEDDDDRVGRRLIGFAEVEDDDALRDELVRRGLGVGAVHNLPRFAAWEVSDA